MSVQVIAALIAGGAALGIVVWLLAKIGRALITIAESLAAAAAVFFVLWLLIKGVGGRCGKHSLTGEPASR
jgi:DNA segregation ATPase FtsK/SpoIIIE, S-DNA-T family